MLGSLTRPVSFRTLAAMSMILLRNARVFAPEPLGVNDLLLGGGRVLWLGTGPLELPTGLAVDVLDAEGRSVIPGLIDGHVHVTGGGGEAGFHSRVPPLGVSRFTRHGVTTVIGLLGTDDVARSARELVATLHGLREDGLGAWGYCGGYHLPPATVTGSVRGDLVFVDCLIGVGELAISDHRSSQPTLEELLRVASEAHVAGLMTGKAGTVHLHVGDGARGLDLVRRALAASELPPQVFHPTHVNRRRALFEEALALAAAGSTVDVTAFPVGPDEDAWSAADAWLRYHDHGAPPARLTISSDGGGCLPTFDAEGRISHMDVGDSGALRVTLAELVARGVPLQRALPAFTSNPATLLRLPRKGRIAVGADADLVVLGADTTVRDVIVGGRVHVRGGQLERRGYLEN